MPAKIQFVFTLLLPAFIWWLLAGNDPASWCLGIPAVILAVAVRRLLPEVAIPAWRPLQLLPFGCYFLSQSVLSGWDVIKRTFNPRLPLDPGVLTYTPRLSNGYGRVFLANTISLLPGTLSADFDGPDLIIHVLDGTSPNTENLRVLEGRVALLFGEEI